MARARNIKPGFFRNADLVELPYEARLLFIGLWTIADRKGRLEDRPKQIKMELFPADNLDCDALLDQLAKIGVVARYQHGDARYLQVVNFEKHQNPHKDEKASSIPGPCGEDAEADDAQGSHDAGTVLAACTGGGNTVAIGLIPDSRFLIPDSNTPLTPQGGKRVRKPKADLVVVMSGFPTFYAAYPRKIGRRAAEKAWMKLSPDEALQAQILGALAAQKPHLDLREDKKYIPHPSTWLNGEHWEDEIPGGRKPAPVEADGRVWWQIAGFEHPGEAANARCHIVNYREFHNGKRIDQGVHA
jgi:hypothetical protein